MRLTLEINRRSVATALGALGAVGVVVVAFLFFNGSLGKRSPSPGASPTAGGSATLTAFQDPGTGFAIAYPKGWKRFDHADPEVRLLVGPGGDDYLLVRVQDLGQAVGPADILALKEQLDQKVEGPNTVVHFQKQVTVGGLQGWYYLYTFLDEDAGKEGVHAHYFLFDGARLFQLVYQALPKGDFDRLADAFDGSAATFRPGPRSATSPAPSPSPS